MKELPIISSGPLIKSQSDRTIVGIDLGTTNSLVAVVEKGVPRVLPTSEGKNLLPSVVHFLKDGSFEIGFRAKSSKLSDPEHTVYSVKRLLGRGVEDIKNVSHHLPYDITESDSTNVKLKVENKSFTPIEISAMILRELKSSAEKILGKTVEDAVITVPAYFNDSQRHATRAAGRLAGFNVLRILNEPTAASLAYGLQKKQNGLIAVFDLGGGTFDISILKLKNGVFEVLATNGDTSLGGDDIDQAIVDWILSTELSTYPQSDLQKIEIKAALLSVAENLKIALSEKESHHEELKLPNGKRYKIYLDQTKLKELLLPLLERVRLPVSHALKDAKLNVNQLTDVVLVGGPTRLPLIRDFVHDLFKRVPNASMHPDEVVALGAAIQADILAGNNTEFLLLDVVPLSLGIETFGGTMSKLIPRNTPIPSLAKEKFTTYVDNQTKVAINIFQGERELVKDNRMLGQFILHDVPPLPAGLARIEVTFLVDADGILNVSAKETYSETEQSVEVKPTYGLTDQDVEKMLTAGFENAEQDATQRKLIDLKNEVRTILHATEKSFPLVRSQMNADQVSEIEKLIENTKKALDSSSLKEVQSAKKLLNEGTIPMAEILMQKNLDEGIKNKNAKDFNK